MAVYSMNDLQCCARNFEHHWVLVCMFPERGSNSCQCEHMNVILSWHFCLEYQLVLIVHRSNDKLLFSLYGNVVGLVKGSLPLSSNCAVPACAYVVMLHGLHRRSTLSYM